MRRLSVFNQVTLNGFFTGPNGDISWAHKHDLEWLAFVEENSKGGGTMVFGRITYDMMASYWPTPLAHEQNPVVAAHMNSLQKVVFSRTLDSVSWANTTLLKGDLATEMRKQKQEPGSDLTILGSGSIVSQLAPAGLIDEFQIVVNPVILGAGRTMFETVTGRLDLALIRTRAFANGSVLLCYEPIR